jgi:enterochelin esterase family protein
MSVIATTHMTAKEEPIDLQRHAPGVVAATTVLSPEFTSADTATFRIKAPNAASVQLNGQWSITGTYPLDKDTEGVWSVTVSPIPTGIWEYHFLLDGLRVIDAKNPVIKAQRTVGWSVLHVPATPPSPWDWQADIPHGTIHRHEYASGDPNEPRALMVYTPPGYENSLHISYPLLVLQHGMGDNERSWSEHGKAHWIMDHLLNDGSAVPMIIVMMNGHFADEAMPRVKGFGRELFEDVLPMMKSNYRILPGPENHAIAGLSMGGGQSLHIGLSNSDTFAWVAAMSAATPKPDSYATLLSDADTLNTQLNLLWIGCGKDDFLFERNSAFIEALEHHGIDHEWRLTEGSHNWPIWRDYLSQLLPKLFKKSL